MEANKKALVPPTNNQVWVPNVSQKERKAILHPHKNKTVENKIVEIEASNPLWLPPSSQREQNLVTSPYRKPVRPSLNIRKLVPNISNIHLQMGLKGKTFWDWLPLLLQVCAALAIAGAIYLGFSRSTEQQMQQQASLSQQTFQEQVRLAQQQALEQEHFVTQVVQEQQLLVVQTGSIADQGHEQLLTAYLNSMTDALPDLKKSNVASSTKLLAQTKTLAIFNVFKADPLRTATVLQFLHDSGLIAISSGNTKGPIISLNNVTLSSISLKQANLSSTSFDGITLINTDLSQATLTSSSFRGATLTKDNFSTANLGNVDFSGANLENANFSGATLKGANLGGSDTKNAILKGAIW
jgi:Pentapeptide repeats (9 copies)